MTRPPGGVIHVGFIGWGESLMQYFQAMAAGGRSPGTIRLHRHYLMMLAAHHGRPWRVTTLQLVAFMSRESWAPETRKSARTVVCGFYRWGHTMGYLDVDPAAGLPSVRVPAGVPRPAPEIVVLSVVNGSGRVAFMAQLAAYAGLRAAEIARVHSHDYTPGAGIGELLVHGKGGKERLVPIMCATALEQRLAAVQGWAFPNGHGSHLSAGHVSKVLSDAMPSGWTAHTLRHRFATRAYSGSRDLMSVSELLGHARLETTQRYVLPPRGALREAVASAM